MHGGDTDGTNQAYFGTGSRETGEIQGANVHQNDPARVASMVEQKNH